MRVSPMGRSCMRSICSGKVVYRRSVSASSRRRKQSPWLGSAAMLHPVTFCPDPLGDPRSLHESNQWWLTLCFTLSAVVHTSLWLAFPEAERVAPAPVFRATEVFDIDPPPAPPVPPDPAPAPASSPELLPPKQASPSPPRPSPQAPALAAAVLTANDNAGPLDFTDTFVTGQATTFSGGATSSRGVISRVP